MHNRTTDTGFQNLNRGFNNTFRKNHLTLGLVVPLENYSHSAVPTMDKHIDKDEARGKTGFYRPLAARCPV